MKRYYIQPVPDMCICTHITYTCSIGTVASALHCYLLAGMIKLCITYRQYHHITAHALREKGGGDRGREIIITHLTPPSNVSDTLLASQVSDTALGCACVEVVEKYT